MFLGLLKVVGLTGGIASGKSTVAQELREVHGLPIIDADAIAHDVLRKGTWGYSLVVRSFGRGIVGQDGEIDRTLLADTVFADAGQRRRLNRIMHPAIALSMAWQILCSLVAGRPALVLDAPLLFETGLNRISDFVVVVSCSREQQIARFMARTGSSEEQTMQRIQSQRPLEMKVALADAVIDNSGPLEATRAQVKAVVERLRVGPSGWNARIRCLIFGSTSSSHHQKAF